MALLLISPAEADAICAEYYNGESLQISKSHNHEQPLSIEWWLSAIRPEKATSVRLWSGVRAFIEISGNASVKLQSDHSFYAMFGHQCGSATRPDKGVCKALLVNEFATFHATGNEFACFQLTPLGLEHYRNHMSQF